MTGRSPRSAYEMQPIPTAAERKQPRSLIDDPSTGRHVACTHVDDTLTAAGLYDPARHAARALNRQGALGDTTGFSDHHAVEVVLSRPRMTDALRQITDRNASRPVPAPKEAS
ncbi:hypothetical protein ACF09H_21700 [Streptomyces sp. NPDC014983]|uniref:hypothetical protein n=1 Tax=Streptomyces sp. NPDC014983 TaxID=3364933 RepID=UPI0036F9C441